jgi:hypothetical protein
MTTDPSPAGGRWFRVNTTWSQSEWLAVLVPAARLAWIEVLSHVKAHGFDGRVRAVAPAVFGRMVGIDAADVRTLLDAAQADGALEVDDGHWIITGWPEHQGDPTGKDRVRRFRDRMKRNDTDVTRYDRYVTHTETETETETEVTDTVSKETGPAEAAPIVDNSPREWLGTFMPMLRENGFDADSTDGSILKHWHKRGYTADEVEAAIRGTAMIRAAGGLKAFEGAKLSLRLLYARPKPGAPPERRPLWNEATEKYHSSMERTKRSDPMAGAHIANILGRIQRQGAA